MAVTKGDTIRVEYTGSFDDGTIFDSSQNHQRPLEFKVGEKQVIPGVDNAVVGMNKGEEKDVTIPPAEGYGDHHTQLVQKVPKNQLPPGDPKPGMILLASLPNGAQMPVKILEVGDQDVTVDLNHPLAGKTLHFKLKILEIKN
ncbi:MAG: peptidylprolyl isomerase [Nanoarchaeota archaeon]|nr:peptidylprolyl isomerase [Nanoarchaeota archaeon]